MSDGYGRSSPAPITRDQAVRLIVRTCLDEGVIDERQIAYVLATAQHESQDFTKPEEDYGRQQAARLGYQGGEEYFGRGYVHLTHLDNYRRLGEALGRDNDLVEAPALAADPEIASQVLVRGMRDGLFTQHRLDQYFTREATDYEGARRIVNGRDRAGHIGALAENWVADVPGLVGSVRRDGVDVTPAAATRDADLPLRRGDANAQAFELQQYLAALNITTAAGRSLSPDGDFGPGTEQAVRSYQRMREIDPQTGVVDQRLFERIRDDALREAPDFEPKSITDLYGPLNDRVLNRGDRGDPVADVQAQLRGLGARGGDGTPLKISRRYDGDTASAVAWLQRDARIEPANGLADEATRDALNARAVHRGLPEAAEAVRRREAAEAEHQAVPRRTEARPGLQQMGLHNELDAARTDSRPEVPFATHQQARDPHADATTSFVERLLDAAHRNDAQAINDMGREMLASEAGQAWLHEGQQQLQANEQRFAQAPSPPPQDASVANMAR